MKLYDGVFVSSLHLFASDKLNTLIVYVHRLRRLRTAYEKNGFFVEKENSCSTFIYISVSN